MYGIKDGIQQNIPTTGILSTGETVANYDCMAIDELTAEGWSDIQEGYLVVNIKDLEGE